MIQPPPPQLFRAGHAPECDTCEMFPFSSYMIISPFQSFGSRYRVCCWRRAYMLTKFSIRHIRPEETLELLNSPNRPCVGITIMSRSEVSKQTFLSGNRHCDYIQKQAFPGENISVYSFRARIVFFVWERPFFA